MTRKVFSRKKRYKQPLFAYLAYLIPIAMCVLAYLLSLFLTR